MPGGARYRSPFWPLRLPAWSEALVHQTSAWTKLTKASCIGSTIIEMSDGDVQARTIGRDPRLEKRKISARSVPHRVYILCQEFI